MKLSLHVPPESLYEAPLESCVTGRRRRHVHVNLRRTSTTIARLILCAPSQERCGVRVRLVSLPKVVVPRLDGTHSKLVLRVWLQLGRKILRRMRTVRLTKANHHQLIERLRYLSPLAIVLDVPASRWQDDIASHTGTLRTS